MKFLIQLRCRVCSEEVTVELRDLGDDSCRQCPRCGKAVPAGQEETWRLLRRLRDEIRQVVGGGAVWGGG